MGNSKKESSVKNIDSIKKKILTLKLQKSVSGLDKPHELKLLKKEVARLLTVKK